MPLPGSRVIPLGWEAHHAPVAEGAMTGTCRVQRPSSAATFNETAHKSEYPTPTVLYTTVGRAQRLPMRGADQSVGDRNVTLQRYQVSIPRDRPAPQINDQVVFTACGDPSLVDLILRVTGSTLGTLRWERDLFCEEVTPTSR